MSAEIFPAVPLSDLASAVVPPLRIAGRLIKIATVEDEIWQIPPAIPDPQRLIEVLRRQKLRADLFSFAQPVPKTEPEYEYFWERENWAVADTTEFARWWDSLPQESRKNTRKAEKNGIAVRIVPFDETLVQGIKALYDETPIRQGRKFWHYGESLGKVRNENGTYLERSLFIAALRNSELIGFVKIVRVGTAGRIMQILARTDLTSLHPMNALLTEAVRTCSHLGLHQIVYGQYVYGNKHGSSVTEFKRRNGFRPMYTPRYQVPLTALGQFALVAGLHRPVLDRIPEPILNVLLRVRTFGYIKLLRRQNGDSTTRIPADAPTPARPPPPQ